MLTHLVAFLAVAAPLPKATPDHVLRLKDARSSEAYLAKQAELMTSRSVLDRASKVKAVQQLVPKDTKDVVRWLGDGVKTDTKRKGELRVWFAARSPRVQKAVLDALYESYLREAFAGQNLGAFNRIDQQRKSIQEQKARLQQQMVEVEAKLAQLVKAQGRNPQAKDIIAQVRQTMEKQTQNLDERLAKYEAQLEQEMIGFRRTHRLQRIPE